ncbi:MAG: tetratricopeptide repeat protein [Candidatus Omnitrophica bacterium]|nr:tetratricopeptide repeat protein [Candidatus Omnitrophota bacterium]
MKKLSSTWIKAIRTIICLYLILSAPAAALAGSVIVQPGPLDHFKLDVTETIQINRDFKVIIDARDAWGNQIINYYETGNGLDVITNGRGKIHPDEVYPWSFEDGRAIVYFKYDKNESFTITIREKNGNILGTSKTIQAYTGKITPDQLIFIPEETVRPGEPDHFLVISPRETIAGEPFNLVIEARDKRNKLIADYNLKGSDVEIVSSPPSADKPIIVKASLFNNGRAVIRFNNTRSGLVSIVARVRKKGAAVNSFLSDISSNQVSVRAYTREEMIARTMLKLDHVYQEKLISSGRQDSGIKICDESVQLFINLFSDTNDEVNTEETMAKFGVKTKDRSPDKIPKNINKSERLFQKGLELSNQGNYIKAKEMLEKALELNPKDKNIQETLKRLNRVIKITKEN